MIPMRIALAQISCTPGDIAGNTRRIVERVRAAASAGANLVALPEMSDTGYHMPTILRTASSWDRGPFMEIAAAAAETKTVVVAGLSERVGDDVYNTVAVVGSGGSLIAKYRKTHLITAEPVCEQRYLKAGDSLTICNVGEWKVGLLTCYDIRFPEIARKLTLSGAELLIAPAAFPSARIGHWETITACRAIENQVYVAAVNRVGTDEGLAFGGCSRLLDPSGVLLAHAKDEDTLLLGDISKTRLAEVRKGLHVLSDRRPEVY
jgi:omega-amidase